VRVIAGQIVLVDWREDALPKEANKLRPCVVVENTDVFDADYPNVVLVPLTEDGSYIIPALSVRIDPTKENGCANICYAVAHAPVTASKRRIARATESRITSHELSEVRYRIAETIGLELTSEV
jgi:mRNA interferase MazF